jgi:outer membrane lipoprotein SlyB
LKDGTSSRTGVVGQTTKEGKMLRTFGAAAMLALATVMPVHDARSQDAIGGAILGGAAGAILGGALTGRGSGAAAGALVGAATGAIIANEASRRRSGAYYWRGGCYSQDDYGNWYRVPRRYC